MTIHPFRTDSFKSNKEYRDWKKANPNCTCTLDGYDMCLRAKVDCPVHGEEHPADAMIDAVIKANPLHPSYDPPPSHYATKAGFDVWAIWDAFDLDRYTAGAIKYLLRAGKKDIAPRLDDLVKARNYIEKAIEFEKSKNHKD